MARQVAILHGWSDTSESFHDLRTFLSKKGFLVTEIWLGDYRSKDDDVRIPDVSKRMQSVLSSMMEKGDLTAPFDLVVHSTGGLVAREWVARYYPDGVGCPIKRIVMLAPANFGSRLAAAGKSFVGRVAKGYDNWFHTGTEMLHGLELASVYQWDLAQRDLLDRHGGGDGPYGRDKIWPFVIAGGRGYTKLFMRVANEDGADGTVRACAANMNCAGLTIDFSEGKEAKVVGWSSRNGDTLFPFAIVPDRNHSTIVRPEEDTNSTVTGDLGELIVEALDCKTPDQYRTIAEAWMKRTGDVVLLGEPDPEGNRTARADARRRAVFSDDVPPASAFHQYMQIIVAVVDDQDQPVDDYFMEFYAPTDKQDDEAVYFQQKVLEHVYVNSRRPNFRCLYIDRTDLMFGYYPLVQEGEPKVVAMSLSAAPIGQYIRYFDSDEEGASGSIIVHRKEDEGRDALGVARLHRNITHLVKIIIPRQPVADVFKLGQPS